MGITTYRLPDELTAELDRVAKRRGVSRTLVVREALTAYLASEPSKKLTLAQLAESLVTRPGSAITDLATRSELYLRQKLGSGRPRGRRRPR